MTHGSLFSGIGGFDLASEWMGWENKFHCEWNGFGQKVLKHYWPKSESYGDITKTDFTIWNGRIDILTGGFPCQPYSQAGKRLGKEDERHLWPEMLRAIREIQPRWVVGENVFGLVNWNDGMVFDEVQADLEAEGYEVQPYVLPAVAVNAPHRRDRIWFVAHRHRNGLDRRNGKHEVEPGQRRVYAFGDVSTGNQYGHDTNANGIGRNNGFDSGQERHVSHDQERNTTEGQSERSQRIGGIGAVCGDGIVANSTSEGWCEGFGQEADIEGREMAKSGQERGGLRDDSGAGYSTTRGRTDEWDNFPTQSPVCGGDDGLPSQLDGITFPKWRNESIKAYGNAIVPQVAHQIFKSIEAYEKIILRSA